MIRADPDRLVGRTADPDQLPPQTHRFALVGVRRGHRWRQSDHQLPQPVHDTRAPWRYRWPDHSPRREEPQYAGQMSEAQLTAAGDSRFELSGTLDFASVPQIWPALDAALRDGATLTLALGGVERANSAGLVLLIEALDVARAGLHLAFFRHAGRAARPRAPVQLRRSGRQWRGRDPGLRGSGATRRRRLTSRIPRFFFIINALFLRLGAAGVGTSWTN